MKELKIIFDDQKDRQEQLVSINKDIWIITTQKKFGKTFEQLLEESEIRRLKAEKKIANLLIANKQLLNKTKYLQKDIEALTSIRFPDHDNLPQSAEQVQRCINNLEKILKSFNAFVFKRQYKEWHLSIRDSFNEAWRRAAELDTIVKELENKINKNYISKIRRRK